MNTTTQGITGSLAAACSEPVQRFLACPFQLTKTDAPNTRVSLTPSRAPGSHGRAPAFHDGKNQLLTSFQDFGLADPISRALKEENYVTPTPIQAQTVPLALAGRDVVGIAQAGPGKAAGFALPVLPPLFENRIKPQPKSPRVLVL